jgi:tetratricopeptide (TPR) repeat protein
MAAPKKIPQQLDAAVLLRQALAYQKRGELDAAERLYRQILDAQPDHFDALHLCGVLMQQRGEPAEALKLIGAALANTGAKPAPAALYNRGNALVALGRLDEALASFDATIAIKSDYAEALLNRAQVLKALRREREAIASFDRAFALAQPSADALVAHGNTHYALGAYAAALADYEAAMRLRPDAAPLYNNRGNALRELGRHDDALIAFDRAIALKPDYAEAHNNRGNALLEINRVTEALASYDHALALKPEFADALVNRGNALHYLGREREALASLDFAIALAPQLAEAHWNKALTCLALGDFAKGLPEYEWRWKREGELKPRDFAQPQWRGEALVGKTILLHAEQGYGDSIQFIRYLPMVVAKGGKVVLEIPDELRPLIGRIDGVVAILRRGDAPPPFDVHCPLMSLPLAFDTTLGTIPATPAYLQAPAERVDKWRARLGGTKRPRVGLVWSGKPTHKNDRNRSMPLALLAPVLRLPDLSFVSLQKEYRDADRAALAAMPLLRLDNDLRDFADTGRVSSPRSTW